MKFSSVITFTILTYICHNLTAFSEINKNEFDRIVKRVKHLYSDEIFHSTGKKLDLLSKWFKEESKNSMFFRSSAIQLKGSDKTMIRINNVVAKNEHISSDAFAFLVCHEFGHHLGGFPKRTEGVLTSWSSVEGQSDYWGMRKCLRNYIRNDILRGGLGSLISFNEISEVPAGYIEKCFIKYFGDAIEQLTCLRMLSAVSSLTKYFNSRKRYRQPYTSLYLKDYSKVEVTRNGHGSNQCRIDTMMAGIFKSKRPSCWFAEENN